MKHVKDGQLVRPQWRVGPLAGWLDAFADWVSAKGYALYTANRMILLVACFSQWLKQEEIGIADINPDHVARYRRVPELVAALIRARDKGTLERLMGRLGRISLLVLDDWGLQGFSAEGRRDLLEIVEARHGRKSILVASQIPVEGWPKVIGEPTIADAVLDRIVHNAYRIELKGESQRKRNKPPPLDGGGNRAPA